MAQPRKRASKRPGSAAAPPAAPETSTAFSLDDDEIERALQTGEYAGLLEDHFGAEQYAELRQLKREAATRSVQRGPRVLILPGIMGSKIGRDRKLNPFDDICWVDPLAIAAGRLKDLALPDGGRFKPIGVMLVAYLKLKLRLQKAGYDAQFHAFDWRQSIDDLGRELKEKLKGKEAEGTSLVAHSMGGLVARSAIAQGAKYHRLIMLGTPNHGSYAPVQALRGTYPVVRKVGWLDRRHTAEELARDVFSTFPGLTQMLPFRGHYEGVDLYDRGVWPEASAGYAPRETILRDAQDVQQGLAPGTDRMFMIAGVNQKTVVGIRVEDGSSELLYELSSDGDGTVPLRLALLPGVRTTYYITEAHGSLANNGIVGNAVVDLLEKDATSILPNTHERPAERGALEVVTESALRVEPYDGRRGRTLSQRELRTLLEEVAAPDAHEGLEPTVLPQPARIAAGTPAPGYVHPFQRVRVGRNNYHRVDVRFAFGSITEADTRAIALGLFRDVAPGGAAAAVDRRMDGAITDLHRRRMFSANVGEIFMLPTGRHQLITDFVTFVGLGPFDQFTDEVLQTASENTIRTLINARVEEFATVLYGGASTESAASALGNMLTGFVRGLSDADHDHHFRRIMICENNPDRYIAIKEELYRLSSTSLCENVELTLDETVLRTATEVTGAVSRAVRTEQPVYLIVRQERATSKSTEIRSSLLTAGEKAAVITGVHGTDSAKLEQARLRVVKQQNDDFTKTGRQLAELVLSEQVRSVLPRYRKHPLIVVHDAATSRIPWETLAFGEERDPWFPAAQAGLSHRYAADNLSVAKWLEERVHDNMLNVLLIVNPTKDLKGAEKEGDRALALLGPQPGCRVKELRRGDATRQAVLAAIGSGEFDVLHYAGHAEFNESQPSRSGIVCANHVRLTGADLSSISRLPTLVFFNACESGRMRNGEGAPKKTREQHVTDNVGLAEAFMRGGVANFLGTYWPVGDDEAEVFAGSFYADIIAGKSVGDALLRGRAAVRKLESPDWANYVFYGNSDFVLKDAGLNGA